MFNLEAIANEEFCVPVRPPVPHASAQIVISEKGLVSLSGKLAEKFAKRPVQLCFNKARTAIQITGSEEGEPLNIVFPKNGQKLLPNAYELLAQRQLSFPVIFKSSAPIEGTKWRGALCQNPTPPCSSATRSKKKN